MQKANPMPNIVHTHLHMRMCVKGEGGRGGGLKQGSELCALPEHALNN